MRVNGCWYVGPAMNWGLIHGEPTSRPEAAGTGYSPKQSPYPAMEQRSEDGWMDGSPVIQQVHTAGHT